MYTTVDKAIVAVIMATLGLLNQFGIVPWTPTAELQNTLMIIITALSPVLVYLIPNKRA